MGRKSSRINLPDARTVAAAIGAPAPVLRWEPTPEMREARAKWWTLRKHDAVVDVRQIVWAEVAREVGEPQIKAWIRRDGFREWFVDKDEWRTDVELAHQDGIRLLRQRIQSGLIKTSELTAALVYLGKVSGREADAAREAEARKTGSNTNDLMEFYRVAQQLGFSASPQTLARLGIVEALPHASSSTVEVPATPSEFGADHGTEDEAGVEGPGSELG